MPSATGMTGGRKGAAGKQPAAGATTRRKPQTDDDAKRAAVEKDELVNEQMLSRDSDIPNGVPDNSVQIAEAAYYLAQQRGFEPGHELDDWLRAERELHGSGNGVEGAGRADHADGKAAIVAPTARQQPGARA